MWSPILIRFVGDVRLVSLHPRPADARWFGSSIAAAQSRRAQRYNRAERSETIAELRDTEGPMLVEPEMLMQSRPAG
jgi:hypothetical protein